MTQEKRKHYSRYCWSHRSV